MPGGFLLVRAGAAGGRGSWGGRRPAPGAPRGRAGRGGLGITLKRGVPVEWKIETATGDPAGKVCANGRGGWDAVGPMQATPATNATLAVAQALITGATAVDTDPVGEREVATLLHRV